MREFKLTFADGVTGLLAWPLEEAQSVLSRKDAAALADLKVGQTYVDSDGDTWERTE